MENFLQNLLTGKDNQTYDIGRILWVIGVTTFICFTAIRLYIKGEFDAMGYGTGLGGLLTGGGLGIGLKAKTEPEK